MIILHAVKQYRGMEEFRIHFPAGVPVTHLRNYENRYSPCVAYQYAFEYNHEDVLIYMHDDVSIFDKCWHRRVMEQFVDPVVVCVGLGGATSLGHPDLYRKTYQVQKMARMNYWSNQYDWKLHGKQLQSVLQVAVVDAFFMAVRRSFLEELGGWPVYTESKGGLTHHCLDLWIGCEAARHNKKVMAVGAACAHWGGGTSTTASYANAPWLQGGTREEDHARPHRWLHQNYSDVLPIKIYDLQSAI